MVKPIIITIDQTKAGQKRIDLPELSGYDILVTRRVIGYLTEAEFVNLPTGGFELKGENDFFVLGEVITVIPSPLMIATNVIPTFSLVQYPHRITLTAVVNSTTDDDGNYVNVAGGETKELDCRAESSTGNGFITQPGGTRIDFSWIVYFPLPIEQVKEGTAAEVRNEYNELILTDTVKRFSRGQLNARIWL